MAALKATLRDYQRLGLTWLQWLRETGVDGILADDMGLGKTIQVLALLVARGADGPALVVAPTSVCAKNRCRSVSLITTAPPSTWPSRR